MYKKNTFQSLLGKNIRRVRISRNLTIEQLAHEANLTYSQVSRIELGKINTSVYTLHILSRTLNVSPMEFLEFNVPVQ
jgi:transcriptional regulator with XRE-family HTH domain